MHQQSPIDKDKIDALRKKTTKLYHEISALENFSSFKDVTSPNYSRIAEKIAEKQRELTQLETTLNEAVRLSRLVFKNQTQIKSSFNF